MVRRAVVFWVKFIAAAGLYLIFPVFLLLLYMMFGLNFLGEFVKSLLFCLIMFFLAYAISDMKLNERLVFRLIGYFFINILFASLISYVVDNARRTSFDLWICGIRKFSTIGFLAGLAVFAFLIFLEYLFEKRLID